MNIRRGNLLVLRAVTVVFLAAYGARIGEALWVGIGVVPLLPYMGAWVSWIALSSWQWSRAVVTVSQGGWDD